MSVLTIVLSALLALAMFQTAVRKALNTSDSAELRDRLELPNRLWLGVGALEAAAAAGLVAGVWWQPLGVAAAIGVALTMVGAVLAHLRLGLTGSSLAPPAVVLALAVATALVGARA